MDKQKIRYINCCIVEFGKKFKLAPRWAFNYLYQFKGIEFLNRFYEAEHLLSIDDAIDDLIVYCKRNGGSIG
jgi:hypothetical protein